MADGNESQNRLIAKQLFSTWEAEQSKRTGKFVGSLPAWIGCVVAVFGVIYGAAFVASDVEENRRRISAVEVTQREQASDNRAMIERLARIEAKLDYLTEKK